MAEAATVLSSGSSSSGGLIDDEDHQTAKVIQKLTGSNLDIKAIDIDFSSMRTFVHTPKNGVKVPQFDVSTVQDKLHTKGFLLFNPMDRPTETLAKRTNSRPKSPSKTIIVVQDSKSALNNNGDGRKKERLRSPRRNRANDAKGSPVENSKVIKLHTVSIENSENNSPRRNDEITKETQSLSTVNKKRRQP